MRSLAPVSGLRIPGKDSEWVARAGAQVVGTAAISCQRPGPQRKANSRWEEVGFWGESLCSRCCAFPSLDPGPGDADTLLTQQLEQRPGGGYYSFSPSPL